MTKTILASITLFIIIGCSSTELYVYNEDYTEAYNPADTLSIVQDISTVNISQPPVILKQVYFKIPRTTNYDRIRGEVVIKMFVTEDGNVSKVKVLNSSDIILNKAMIDTYMQWKFVPAKQNNRPVSSWINWPVRIVQPTGR